MGGRRLRVLAPRRVELHLGEVEALDPTTNTVSVYLFVADADQLHTA